jgi:hypothetical protein
MTKRENGRGPVSQCTRLDGVAELGRCGGIGTQGCFKKEFPFLIDFSRQVRKEIKRNS